MTGTNNQEDRPRFVNGSDFFRQPPPNEDQETRSTSMGHASGVQQLHPRRGSGRQGANVQGQVPRNRGNALNLENMNVNTLYENITFFGTDIPVYALLIIAVIAFYVWGIMGIAMIGIAYWVSTTFQQQNPPLEYPGYAQQPMNDSGNNPTNPGNTPSSSSQSSGSAKRFPGQGNALGR
mmetsp:Transcript_4417/g.7292  ORF Transcript_4417/g.7292 Transcript_4417/m.7292 type:complete len:179 (-) Transcript_4417:21-557(-)